MADNVSQDDFEKLKQVMAEVALIMRTGLQDSSRVVKTESWEHCKPIEQTIPMSRRPPDRLNM